MASYSLNNSLLVRDGILDLRTSTLKKFNDLMAAKCWILPVLDHLLTLISGSHLHFLSFLTGTVSV